jgi:hypothetical protein
MFFLRWTPLTASGTRAMWLLPVADPAVTAGLSWPCYGRPAPWCGVERFAVASAGWHLLYLATCAALLASLVLTRRRVRVVGACASLTVLVPTAVIQLP